MRRLVLPLLAAVLAFAPCAAPPTHRVGLRLYEAFRERPSGVFASAHPAGSEMDPRALSSAATAARAFGMAEALTLAAATLDIRDGEAAALPVTCSQGERVSDLSVRLKPEHRGGKFLMGVELNLNGTEIFHTTAEMPSKGETLTLGASHEATGRVFVLSLTVQGESTHPPTKIPSSALPFAAPAKPDENRVSASFCLAKHGKETAVLDKAGAPSPEMESAALKAAAAWKGRGVCFVHFR